MNRFYAFLFFCLLLSFFYHVQSDDIEALQSQIDQINSDIDTAWLILTGALVFFMQVGFAMVEAGCVRSKNVGNILMKNTLDAAMGAIVYYAIGYAFAYGDDGLSNSFIGTKYFALQDTGFSDYAGWFFQFAFAATAATIVSGAMAERTKFVAYIVYSCFITGFIYPVVSHWIWAGDGWLTAFRPDPLLSVGVIDFAGSTVVHSVGGWASLVGAIVVGPRVGRFENPRSLYAGHSQPLVCLGTLILWVGWYGFNCGSTLGISGNLSSVAGRVAVTTTLGAGAGGFFAMLFSWLSLGASDVGMTLNGVLGGLVAITAGCATLEPWAAIIAGGVGGVLIVYGTKLLEILKIDDPVGAIPVHLFNGVWGTFVVGLLSSKRLMTDAYGVTNHYGAFMGSTNANLLVVQIYAILVVGAWTVGLSTVLFLAIKFTIGIRVPADEEKEGLDASEHKSKAYPEYVPAPFAEKNMTSPQNSDVGVDSENRTV